MESDSIKPKSDLEPFYTAIFLSRVGGFVAQRLLRTSKGLSGLWTTLGQRRDLRLGRMGLRHGSTVLWARDM
jgi:hypothetical protein